jgi:hypothetical protein
MICFGLCAATFAECPFAHEGEKATRRCPALYLYSSIVCPDVRQVSNSLGPCMQTVSESEDMVALQTGCCRVARDNRAACCSHNCPSPPVQAYLSTCSYSQHPDELCAHLLP